MEQARANVGAAAFDAARAVGCELTIEQAMAEALAVARDVLIPVSTTDVTESVT